MLPFEGQSLEGYPPNALRIAGKHQQLLQSLPAVLAASLLRELRGYDWQFPAERREMDAQLQYLETHNDPGMTAMFKQFADLPLPREAEGFRWASQPELFLEMFTANLWSSHAMDQFRACGEAYGLVLQKVREQSATSDDRLVLVLMGRGARKAKYPLFEQLRKHGTYFSNVDTSASMQEACSVLHTRAQKSTEPFAHWYVDGAAEHHSGKGSGIAAISFDGLASVRTSLSSRMKIRMAQGTTGPEAVRTDMLSLQPGNVTGFADDLDSTMRHFALRILSDGSGTQVFSTTFVQWTAREVLRRAAPRTLLLRYAPRVSDLPMNFLEGDLPSTTDPVGALQDADMGAYYTWLNLERLSGSGRKVFIAVFECGNEAIAITPALPARAVSTNRATLREIIGWAVG